MKLFIAALFSACLLLGPLTGCAEEATEEPAVEEVAPETTPEPTTLPEEPAPAEDSLGLEAIPADSEAVPAPAAEEAPAPGTTPS